MDIAGFAGGPELAGQAEYLVLLMRAPIEEVDTTHFCLVFGKRWHPLLFVRRNPPHPGFAVYRSRNRIARPLQAWGGRTWRCSHGSRNSRAQETRRKKGRRRTDDGRQRGS